MPHSLTASVETKSAIFDLLVAAAGASELDRDNFLRFWPECKEFRFCGKFGFGGKIWAPAPGVSTPHPYISYYREDETKERHDLSIELNIKLAELW